MMDVNVSQSLTNDFESGPNFRGIWLSVGESAKELQVNFFLFRQVLDIVFILSALLQDNVYLVIVNNKLGVHALKVPQK